MCGIYGTTIKYSQEQIITKLDRTNFRGPDKTSFKEFSLNDNQSLILGHNRLAIIDLDARSNQPFNYENLIHVVFNGEIYNFKSIRKSLIKKGYKFKTDSDTEVICAAYLEYNEECLSLFNGMFAFVIYDVKKNILFGARDRLGQKPFYYYLKNNKIEFASQISSIRLYNKALTISNKAIQSYLSWGYIPDNISIFNEVKKLPAGHYFNLNLSNYEFNISNYWDIDSNNHQIYSYTNYTEAQNELESLLKDAVKSRLFADVPVGIFLSGGVDSSIVASLATKSTAKKIKTFSVKFNEEGVDESIYAKQVANHINSEHHIIECNYSDGINLIENFTHFYDEPFADPSAIPSMLLAKHTRKNVTVALSGDGGDEIFLGYHRYMWVKYLTKIYSFPGFMRKAGSNLLNLLPHYKPKVISRVIRENTVENAYLSTLFNPTPYVYNTVYDLNDFDELKYLLNSKKNIYERVSGFDIKTYLNFDINTKVDRATMAYSLEARSPLMDHRVVEFARGLPTEFKFYKNNQKRILKDILYKHVPKEVFDRPKAGFTMPFKEWFKSELKDFVLSELSEKEMSKIPGIKPQNVTKIVNEHLSGKWNRYNAIWSLLVLKQWMNNYSEGYSFK